MIDDPTEVALLHAALDSAQTLSDSLARHAVFLGPECNTHLRELRARLAAIDAHLIRRNTVTDRPPLHPVRDAGLIPDLAEIDPTILTAAAADQLRGYVEAGSDLRVLGRHYVRATHTAGPRTLDEQLAASIVRELLRRAETEIVETDVEDDGTLTLSFGGALFRMVITRVR